jgi:hypothetical protein
MNRLMARLIFCFFAENTDIFSRTGLFTATIGRMSAKDSSNTHEVIGEVFRAMNTRIEDRAIANVPRWADVFPYVNGGLFSGSMDVPRFSRIARSYLLHIGNLDWTKINPDIFGSMIQAVAEDEERGALGMHYTSVPNILKVLNPLFLDDLRARLQEAGNNLRMLLNLRKRMSRVRVFDPACGSGNFLVIAYKEMRAIEAEINRRRGEADRRTEIPSTNFRGIELRSFPAEIARLALIIAEFQCDVLYRGQKEALAEFLPLDAQNWITCGNALRLDWLSICPPNAGVIVAIVGISGHAHKKRLFSIAEDGSVFAKEADHINAYLVAGPDVVVKKANRPPQGLCRMDFGNKPVDGGHLLLTSAELSDLALTSEQRERFVRRIYGSAEFIRGLSRCCLWIDDEHLQEALSVASIARRVEGVRRMRLASPKAATIDTADCPHRFGEVRQTGHETVIIVPSVSSESREYLPVGYSPPGTIVSNLAFALCDAPLWNIALIASRLHLMWIATVCGKLKADFRYSNTLGWNTFPVPSLTEKNKADLIRSAEDILLAREAHFPATIADLYDPDAMPADLREAHERNDEVLERIYIGRRFRNDTERLEKLFDLYTKMTSEHGAKKRNSEAST